MSGLGSVLKKGSTAPAETDLIIGGLAVDVVGKQVYSKASDGSIFAVGSANTVSSVNGRTGVVTLTPPDLTWWADTTTVAVDVWQGNSPDIEISTADSLVVGDVIKFSAYSQEYKVTSKITSTHYQVSPVFNVYQPKQGTAVTVLKGAIPVSHTVYTITGLASTTTSLTSGGTGVQGTSTVVARADHTHTLPAYPTTLPASDVSAWAKATTKPSYTDGELFIRRKIAAMYSSASIGATSINITIPLTLSVGKKLRFDSYTTEYTIQSMTDYGAYYTVTITPGLVNSLSAGFTSVYLMEDIFTVVSSKANNAGNENTVSTAIKLATARTISITGDLSYTSPSFDGSGNVTAVGTLAAITDSGTGAFKKITTNTKGLVTGTANVVQADITSLLGTGSITNAMLANTYLTDVIATATNGNSIFYNSTSTKWESTPAYTKTQIDTIVGSIATALDAINNEVL